MPKYLQISTLALLEPPSLNAENRGLHWIAACLSQVLCTEDVDAVEEFRPQVWCEPHPASLWRTGVSCVQEMMYASLKICAFADRWTLRESMLKWFYQEVLREACEAEGGSGGFVERSRESFCRLLANDHDHVRRPSAELLSLRSFCSNQIDGHESELSASSVDDHAQSIVRALGLVCSGCISTRRWTKLFLLCRILLFHIRCRTLWLSRTRSHQAFSLVLVYPLRNRRGQYTRGEKNALVQAHCGWCSFNSLVRTIQGVKGTQHAGPDYRTTRLFTLCAYPSNAPIHLMPLLSCDTSIFIDCPIHLLSLLF